MNIIDYILDNTARQRYVLLRLFMEHPDKSFSRKKIMLQMGKEPYKSILIRGSQEDGYNPLCPNRESFPVPTILIDRLKELVKENVIERDKDGKEVTYKLKRNLGANPFEETNFKQKDYQELLRWKASLDKYKELPYGKLLEILDERSRLEFNDGNGKEELFTIVDFETPFVKENHLRERIMALYWAICDRQYISKLTYEGHFFAKNRPKTIHLNDFMPYVLKESRGQWYVVGKCPNEKDFIAIPVNRIIGEIKFDTNKEFLREQFKPEDYWDGCVGITRYGSPLTVSFEVKNGSMYNNIDYIRIVPIVKGHQKVQVLGEWIKITLEKVYMGPELVRVIRSFGKDNIRDVKPTWLKEDLWEAGDRENITFSFLFRNADEIDQWKIDAEKQLLIESNGENADACILIKKIHNKKGWYQVTLKNVLVNSVLYFFIDMLLLNFGDKRISIRERSFLK